MAAWTEVEKYRNSNATAGFLVDDFMDTGLLSDVTQSDGWTKVPKESADD